MTIVAEMFGTVKKVQSEKIHVPDRAMFERPFDNIDAVSHQFCENCGEYWELTFCGTKSLAKKAKINLKGIKVSNYYFIVPLCDDCVGEEGEVIMKKISNLPKPITTNK